MYRYQDARSYPPLACDKLNKVLRAFIAYKNEAERCDSKKDEEIAACYLIGYLENALGCYIFETD